MGQLFSSNKNDYIPPRPPENRGIFTGSSNFSYTSSSMYTQPGVQTIPKKSESTTTTNYYSSNASSSNFSYVSSPTYTQPSVQTATKESKPKIAVSSASSSGTFSYAPRSTYPQPNTHATPSTTRDYPSNAILTHYDNVSSTASTTKDKHSATSDTIKKAYGYYKCSCGAWWESAHSWAHETQDCKQCGENVYPYRQEELQHKDHYDDEPKAPHREDLCGMCKKLGRSCTLIMFASGNARYPNDVLVKGLPMDINESKLKEKFRFYGTILKVTIPTPKEHSQYRIAFITFEDREAALQKFNAVDNSSRRDRRLKIT